MSNFTVTFITDMQRQSQYVQGHEKNVANKK